MAILIGIDVGTTNWKTAAFTADGKPFAIHKTPTPTHVSPEGFNYYDPEELWRCLCDLLQRTAADCAGQEILGISVTSMAEAIIPIDKEGHPLFPAIAWYEGVAKDEAAFLESRLGADHIFSICGLPIDAAFPLPKMMWMRSHHPKVYERSWKWLQMADYVYYKLCGATATDYTIACRTLAYDLHARSWSKEMLDTAQVPAALFPEVMKSGSLLGTVNAAAAEETGLPRGTRVFAGGHDHPCATITSGCMSGRKLMDSSGTVESWLLLSEKGAEVPCTPEGARIGLYLDPERYVLWGDIKTSGASADWGYRHLASMSDWTDTSSSPDYDAILGKCAEIPIGSEGVLYIPHLRGSGAPGWNLQDRGAFLGLNVKHTAPHLLRAVFEGLCCQARIIVEMHARISGMQPEGVCVAGGSTKNLFWQQMKADLLQMPIELSPFDDATVQGAAMLAGIGSGVYGSIEEVSSALAVSNRILIPDPEKKEAYDRLYRRYCMANETVNSLHRALSESEV